MLSTVGINQSTCFQPNKALPTSTSTSSTMFNTVLIIVALCATYISNVKTASRCVRAWCVVVMRVCVFHGCVCVCFMGTGCVCVRQHVLLLVFSDVVDFHPFIPFAFD